LSQDFGRGDLGHRSTKIIGKSELRPPFHAAIIDSVFRLVERQVSDFHLVDTQARCVGRNTRQTRIKSLLSIQQAVSLIVACYTKQPDQEDGIKVFSVNPDFCAAGLGGPGEDLMKIMGVKYPREGGERLVAVAKGKRDPGIGKIVDRFGLLP
jgi:hypothetical protein